MLSKDRSNAPFCVTDALTTKINLLTYLATINASVTAKTLNFSNAADLNLIKAEVTGKTANLAGIDADAVAALIDDTATSIKNVNDEIAKVTDLGSDETKAAFSTMQALIEEVKEAVGKFLEAVITVKNFIMGIYNSINDYIMSFDVNEDGKLDETELDELKEDVKDKTVNALSGFFEDVMLPPEGKNFFFSLCDV